MDSDLGDYLIGKQTNYGIWKEFKEEFGKPRRCTSMFCTIVHSECLTGHRDVDVPPVMISIPYVPRVTIAMLPDVALLKIFDFYVHGTWQGPTAWYKLVHVCQKWRNIAFGSPSRLDLRLYCRAGTPVMKTLDVWPLLPIVIDVKGYMLMNPKFDVNDIVAALKHNDRVCKLALSSISSPQMETYLAEMQQPFPALTDLDLSPGGDETSSIDPDSFLGGSAPRLQTLILDHIPFPGLPKLLLSATHLVHLELWNIPHSGYISPKAMVAGLSVLTRLEYLEIRFKSPRSRPDHRRPPPPTRTLLPVLADLSFKGVSEYLEDLLALIDTPRLDNLEVIFFHQLLFDTPQLALFISRTPKFKTQDNFEARLNFSYARALVKTFDRRLSLGISCRQSDWQFSSLAQLCGSSFSQALISTVENLHIEDDRTMRTFDDNDNHDISDIESSQWVEFLHPFIAVKRLYTSSNSAPIIAPALQELVGETVTEVLPALQTLFLERLPSKPVQEAIERFVSARQLSSHPIAVSRWTRKLF